MNPNPRPETDLEKSLRADNAQLRADLAAAREEALSAANRIGEMEDDISNLQNECTSLRREKQAYTESNRALTARAVEAERAREQFRSMVNAMLEGDRESERIWYGEYLDLLCPVCECGGSFSFHEGEVEVSDDRGVVMVNMHGSGCGHSFALTIRSHGGMTSLKAARVAGLPGDGEGN